MVPGVTGEEVALWVCLWVTTSLKRKMSRCISKPSYLMINSWWFCLDNLYCYVIIPNLDDIFVIPTFGGFQLGGGFVDLLVLRSPRQWVLLRGGWRLHPGETLLILRWHRAHDLWQYLKWWIFCFSFLWPSQKSTFSEFIKHWQIMMIIINIIVSF